MPSYKSHSTMLQLLCAHRGALLADPAAMWLLQPLSAYTAAAEAAQRDDARVTVTVVQMGGDDFAARMVAALRDASGHDAAPDQIRRLHSSTVDLNEDEPELVAAISRFVAEFGW